MKSQNPFSHILKNKDPGDIKRAEDASWEHERVRHLMKKLGMSKEEERKLSKECENFCGDPLLRFDVFRSQYPTFPFLLSANRLRRMQLPHIDKETPNNYQVHADPACFEPARYKQFERVPFVVAFHELQEQVDDPHQTIGVVFPRKGLRQGMVIHNDLSEQYWLNGSSWVYKAKDGSKLFVQPFEALIMGIRNARWKP